MDEGAFLEVGLMGAEGMVGRSLLLGEDVSNRTVIVQVPGEATRLRAKDFKKGPHRLHARAVIVLDRKRLEESSCECYTVISDRMDKVSNQEWRRNSPKQH